jgi:predicted esterase
MKIVFAHGKEGNPNGTKATKLREEFGADTVLVPLLSGKSHVERAAVLLETISNLDEEYILIGSSMGGATALLSLNDLLINSKNKLPKHLLLLAPVLVSPMDLGGVPTTIIHGDKDKVVLFDGSASFADRFGCKLISVKDDHSLVGSLDVILETVQTVFK